MDFVSGFSLSRIAFAIRFRRMNSRCEIILGALAQLGEHLLCKQGVIGSIPIRSTNYIRSFGLNEQHPKLEQAAGYSEGMSKSAYPARS